MPILNLLSFLKSSKSIFLDSKNRELISLEKSWLNSDTLVPFIETKTSPGFKSKVSKNFLSEPGLSSKPESTPSTKIGTNDIKSEISCSDSQFDEIIEFLMAFSDLVRMFSSIPPIRFIESKDRLSDDPSLLIVT